METDRAILFFGKDNPNPDYRNPPEGRDMEMESDERNENTQAQKESSESPGTQRHSSPTDPVDSTTSSEPQPVALDQTSLPIESIKIGNRFRQNLGDLSKLMQSIKDVGLIHPPAVMADGRLVAGRRRIEAFKRLGFSEIPVYVVNVENLAQAEHDENVFRMDFSPVEALTISEALRPMEEEKARERKKKAAQIGGKAAGRGRSKEQAGGKLPQPCQGRTRDKIAARTGYSATSLRKIKEIKEAGEKNPDRYGHLVEEMEEKKRINPVYQELKRLQGEDSAFKDKKAAQPPQKDVEPVDTESGIGTTPQFESEESHPKTNENELEEPRRIRPRFESVTIPQKSQIIVVNAPWENGNRSSFSPMSVDEISALPVANMAADDCFLWLRTPSSHMGDAFLVLGRWGFIPKDILTWVNPEAEPGEWLRNQTEHFIFATKGNPVVDKRHQFASALYTSRKSGTQIPSGFHKLIELFCPAKTHLELFAQDVRPGWSIWSVDDQHAASDDGTPASSGHSLDQATKCEANQTDRNAQMNPVSQETGEKESPETVTKHEVAVGNDGQSIETVEVEAETHEITLLQPELESPHGQAQLLAETGEADRVVSTTEGESCDNIDTNNMQSLVVPSRGAVEENGT